MTVIADFSVLISLSAIKRLALVPARFPDGIIIIHRQIKANKNVIGGCMFSYLPIDTADFIRDQGQLLLKVKKPARAEYLLTSWSQGLSLFQKQQNIWMYLNQGPNIRLLSSQQYPPIQKAFQDFCSYIPEDIQNLVACYQWQQLTILRLLRQDQQIIDLARSCPNLLWLMANRINENDFPLEYASDAVKQKRKDILRQIIDHGSKSLIKLMNKLRPFEYNYKELRLIYQVLESKENISVLRHCQEINLPQLNMIIEQPECAQLPIVRSLLEAPHHSPFKLKRIKMLVKGCLHLTQGMNIPDLWKCLLRCRSVSELQQLYEQLNIQYNQRYMQQKTLIEEEEAAQVAFSERFVEAESTQDRTQRSEKKSAVKQDPPFPPPPLPGDKFIKPITTPSGLRYESSNRAMSNCVGSKRYITKVANGETYIYRIHKPQRCTLEIEKTSSGKWRIVQLKLRDNQSPRSETKNMVYQWLSKANQNYNI